MVLPGQARNPGGNPPQTTARPHKPVTIADVAALAGVSPGTASKAVNGRGQLRAQTRARVLDAAERLGFQPNALAQGLLSGRSYTVGLIATDSFARFSIPVMLGAEDALGVGQISVLLCVGRNDPIRERHHIRTLTTRRVDGIIVTGRRIDPRPAIAERLDVPVVYAMAQSTDPDDTSVIPDEEYGARLAVEHLVAIGRSHIAHITGPDHFLAARLRATGATDALAKYGMSLVEPGPMFGEWSEAWGRQAVSLLQRRGAEFDAVFCGSDQIARGVVDWLREARRRVPHDVAVVGYDNWTVMAAAARPPLTTVEPDLVELGRDAATRLLAAIGGQPERGVHRHKGRLILRESTVDDQFVASSLPPLAAYAET